jgi:hypothetical protein
MTLWGANPWKGYAYVREYHPHRGGRNPSFGVQDGLTLDFKEGKEPGFSEGVRDLGEQIRALGATPPAGLLIVPGHLARPSNAGTPLANAAHAIAGVLGSDIGSWVDALIRHTDIPKLALGGPRNVEVHLESIRVEGADSIRGRDVVLLDVVYPPIH